MAILLRWVGKKYQLIYILVGFQGNSKTFITPNFTLWVRPFRVEYPMWAQSVKFSSEEVFSLLRGCTDNLEYFITWKFVF